MFSFDFAANLELPILINTPGHFILVNGGQMHYWDLHRKRIISSITSFLTNSTVKISQKEVT